MSDSIVILFLMTLIGMATMAIPSEAYRENVVRLAAPIKYESGNALVKNAALFEETRSLDQRL